MTPEPRSTREVVESHLDYRLAGDLDGDLAENYDDDVVVLSWGEGINRGKDAVRGLASILQGYVPGARYSYDQLLVTDGFAMLRWSAQGPGVQVFDGTDSFVVRAGRIVAQSIAYTVEGDRE